MTVVLHPEQDVSVCTILHGEIFNRCWDVSVWTKVVDQPTDRHKACCLNVFFFFLNAFYKMLCWCWIENEWTELKYVQCHWGGMNQLFFLWADILYIFPALSSKMPHLSRCTFFKIFFSPFLPPPVSTLTEKHVAALRRNGLKHIFIADSDGSSEFRFQLVAV